MLAPPRTEAWNVLDDSERVRTVRLMILALLASALTISALAFLLGWAVIPQICLVGAGSLAVAFALFRSGRFRSAVWHSRSRGLGGLFEHAIEWHWTYPAKTIPNRRV